MTNQFSLRVILLFGWVFFFSLVFNSSEAHGQSSVDSLENLLSSGANEEVQIAAKIKLSRLLRRSDASKAMDYGLAVLAALDTAVESEPLADLYINIGYLHLDQRELSQADGCFSRALEISNTLDLDESKLKSYTGLATIYYFTDQREQAHLHCDSAISLAQKSENKLALSTILTIKGAIYFKASDFPNALIYLERNRKIAEELQNRDQVGRAHLNLGKLYGQMGDLESQIKQTEQALVIAKELEDDYAISQALYSLAATYNKTKEFDKSLDYYDQAAIARPKNMNNSVFFGGMYVSIAQIYDVKKQLDSTMYYVKRGLDQLKGMENHPFYNTGLTLYGRTLILSGSRREGIKQLEKALKTAEESDQKDRQRSLHQLLAETYEEMGQRGKAYGHFKSFISFRDTIENQNTLAEMTETRLNSEFARKQLSDSMLNVQQLSMKNVELAKKQNAQRYTMIALLLLLAVLGLIYRAYRNQIKTSKIITQEKQEAERQKNRAEQSESKLKDLDAAKTRLYTNITHEFRTPLSVITGMAAQLKENPTKRLGEGLDMMERNGYRLLGLVNQMLDLNKLESGKISLNNKQDDIVQYVKYLAQSLDSLFESKEIELAFKTNHETIFMDFDEIRIDQLVINLLSNAVKFTPAGGQVELQLNKIEEENTAQSSFFEIKVIDNGVGIEANKLPSIFDRFYQVDDSNTRPEEGTGIGLALVDELVKLMNGKISVKSEIGVGTEFTIQLPISQAAERVQRTATQLQLKSPNINSSSIINAIALNNEVVLDATGALPTLLIIEDNLDVVAYLHSCLEDQYRMIVGYDGEEGVEMAFHHTPDIIITDLMMPKKDGYEVCQQLKTDERTSHIPIVMLTAKADQSSKLAGFEHGADAYLGKPFDKQELIVRLRKLLELRTSLQTHYLTVAGLQESTSTDSVAEIAITPEHEFIINMRKIIEENLTVSEFTVDEFSQKACLSPSQLNRKLSALANMSANKFIRTVRLSKAKELLKDDSVNIAEIAYTIGFSSPGYFSRLFRKEVGMTPREWRDSAKESNTI